MANCIICDHEHERSITCNDAMRARSKPAGLTPEMLSEEDRKAWEFAKQVLLDFRSRMDGLRIKSTTDVFQGFYEHERDMAHKGVLLICRLLTN
jgi:hypothetical protein